MPVILHGVEDWPLQQDEVEQLWQLVVGQLGVADDAVGVRVIDMAEMQRLNKTYRGKDAPTNVLTFSYEEGEHDVALCLEVAAEEAQVRGVDLKDYAALLLVHAFLHAAGLDHERSAQEAGQTQETERDILRRAGYSPIVLE